MYSIDDPLPLVLQASLAQFTFLGDYAQAERDERRARRSTATRKSGTRRRCACETMSLRLRQRIGSIVKPDLPENVTETSRKGFINSCSVALE